MRTALLFLLMATAATAAEKLTLTFADGKKKSATLQSFDDEALIVVLSGKERRVVWEELAPESAYRARKMLTPYDEGNARLGLAEFAVRLKLFAEAIEQLEIAFALEALDQAAFEKRSKEIQTLEVDYLCGRIDTLLAVEEQPGHCLEAIKRLRERYPDHANNARYEPHIVRLVDLLRERAEAEQAAKEKAEDDADLSALRKKLGKLFAKKVKALEKAETLIDESIEAIEKRQVSRVKKKLVEPQGAERYLKRARGYLRKMTRLDRDFRVLVKSDLIKEDDAIASQLVHCYLGVARALLQQRNYKGAAEYVRKLLYYDPIHEEALEMVEEIRKHRIVIKVSDITNARPRVTSGG
ncbi:MAG: hypothetical protein ACYTGV_06225 [Planctomycetota bacterium]|jgi:tetratricopeptide (TPR) repeat protein